MAELDATRRSWNHATRLHNSHKGDQAQRLRDGWEPLFEEELKLLGDLSGRRLVHLQCNSGQDSLALARRGAEVLGVDLSDEAVAFAQSLSRDAQIPARFHREDVLSWMANTEERFELAFSSYGAVGWIEDITAWARGIERVLVPGGRFVYVEFHPLVWSVSNHAPFGLAEDDYFQAEPFVEPVGDYVADSGAALGAVPTAPAPEPQEDNPHSASSWQHGLSTVVSSLARAGLVVETLEEWPYSNGCRLRRGLVPLDERRWTWPGGTARVPLMFGLSLRKPS